MGNTAFIQPKIDGKMIFTWSFLAFHDIPGLGKYGFLRSDVCGYAKGKTRHFKMCWRNKDVEKRVI